MEGEVLPPVPSVFRLVPGIEVGHRGRKRLLVAQVSINLILIEDPTSGERTQVPVHELAPWLGETGPVRKKVPDLALIPDNRRAEALRRKEAIDGLLQLKHRTRASVNNAAVELGLSASHLYGLMQRYQRQGTWTCLAPFVEKGRPRKKNLPALTEEIIKEVVEELYLTRNHARLADVVREARVRCERAGQLPPAPNSVRARVRALDPATVVAAREGQKAARDRHGIVLGAHDEPRWPFQRWEIDHTVADCYLVDEETRLPIARPVLTVVIDAFSRMVAGFYVSLRPPSTLSVALALTHAVLPKADFLKSHAIESPWDCSGLPEKLFTDNAAEFDSRGLQFGCAQYQIHGQFRPLGRPHFGGRVERLIGTLMGRLKLMPGATLSSIAERGEGYDPEKHAAYTLRELETRIATEVCDVYHRSRHSAIGTTPLDLYTFGILGDDKTPGHGLPFQPSDPARFLLDFLPAERRTIQRYGLQIHGIRFHAPILRALPKKAKDGEDYVVRYDPRDLSKVWLYVPDEAQYFEVPRALSHLPPVALWEVKAATKDLQAQGSKTDDEEAVQRAIERIRVMDGEAVRKSKQARKRQELRRLDARERAAATEPAVPPAVEQTASDGLEAPSPAPRRRIQPIADLEAW
jgi:putative transposase